eukprot:scaffold94169_cov62-Attheya_sp.AAC.6
MAEMTSNSVFPHPEAKTKQIGSIVEDKLDMLSGFFSYSEHHRMKRASDHLRWGDLSQQYGCVVHLLEVIKEHDKDTQAHIKVFALSISPLFYVNKSEFRKSQLGVSKLEDDTKTLPIFAMRFGGISIHPGSAVQHAKAHLNVALSTRSVQTLDTTFLTSNSHGHGTSCDIIKPMAESEITLDSITVDAENESQNVWSFALETCRHCLGDRSR